MDKNQNGKLIFLQNVMSTDSVFWGKQEQTKNILNFYQNQQSRFWANWNLVHCQCFWSRILDLFFSQKPVWQEIYKINTSTKFQVSSLYRSRIIVSTSRWTHTHGLMAKKIFLAQGTSKTWLCFLFDKYLYFLYYKSKNNCKV